VAEAEAMMAMMMVVHRDIFSWIRSCGHQSGAEHDPSVDASPRLRDGLGKRRAA